MSKTLNAIGKVCPFPLVEAKEVMETVARGEVLTIDFDCTQATESIPRWAAESGYTVTNYEQLDNASWTISVQKK